MIAEVEEVLVVRVIATITAVIIKNITIDEH